MRTSKKGFTFVELIVAATIIVILGTIGFISYTAHLVDARDSQRKSELARTVSALKLYKRQRGIYPNPGDSMIITNDGTTSAYQGVLNKDVTLITLDSLPQDPKTEKYFSYSIFKTKKEFQLALSLENGDFPIAMVDGDYKTVSINVLPTIILAQSGTGSVEIQDGVGAGATNRDYFILNKSDSLPYSFEEPYDPYYAETDIDTILAQEDNGLWQNADYKNCTEIEEAGKDFGDGEYQILNGSGVLEDTTCTY